MNFGNDLQKYYKRTRGGMRPHMWGRRTNVPDSTTDSDVEQILAETGTAPVPETYGAPKRNHNTPMSQLIPMSGSKKARYVLI